METAGIVQKRHETLACFALCLMGALFVLSGCGSSVMSGGSDGGSAPESGESQGMSRDLPDSAAGPASGQEIAAVEQDSPDSAAAGDAGDFERRVIKTADLGLTSGSVRETASIAQVIAERAGGT